MYESFHCTRGARSRRWWGWRGRRGWGRGLFELEFEDHVITELELPHGRLERYRGDFTCRVVLILADFEFRWGGGRLPKY